MDVLAGLGLGGRPVGAAELVELGGFGADVFADLVELVGGDEQFVRRGAALGRRIFDDQVFASGFVGAGADDALTHFDEPANAVLLVHHVIAFLSSTKSMALRRRFGVLATATAEVRPVRSRSVSRAILAALSTKPSMA